jgi:hypothetical protein
MRNKEKLNLIDNYISIFRLLYNCKNIVVSNHDHCTLNIISSLTSQTIELKKNYEDAFNKLGIIDDTFLQLQQELNDCISDTNHSVNFNIKEANSTLLSLQSDFIKLKEKHSF